eukprot:6756374-Pyramimonas_sp.AAC.1
MKSKNRTDRSGAVPAAVSKAAAAAAAPAAAKKVSPPKFCLEQGRKWVIENQVREIRRKFAPRFVALAPRSRGARPPSDELVDD